MTISWDWVLGSGEITKEQLDSLLEGSEIDQQGKEEEVYGKPEEA